MSQNPGVRRSETSRRRVEKSPPLYAEMSDSSQPGGEPLWNVPNELAIFYPLRGRPNPVLNRRLPEITARAVSSIASFEDRSSARRANRPNPR